MSGANAMEQLPSKSASIPSKDERRISRGATLIRRHLTVNDLNGSDVDPWLDNGSLRDTLEPIRKPRYPTVSLGDGNAVAHPGARTALLSGFQIGS